MAFSRVVNRLKIKRRVRRTVKGTPERPRLSVYRSNKDIYVQIVNDEEGRTLASTSSLKNKKAHDASGVEQARHVGQAIAEMAKAAGIDKVVFDRNGYLYHGRVKALAEAAREAGLNFDQHASMSDTHINKVKSSDLELKDRLVALNRVTKVTKGGRTFTFAAIVVVGNENGVVGHGLGKAKEVQEAIAKGIDDAKKNLVRVPVRKGTIPHQQDGKFAGARVLLKPAAHGTGVIAGGAMRAVLESVGITDVLAKSKGSSNPHNVVKATIDALTSLRDASRIAHQRGVELSKVFNG